MMKKGKLPSSVLWSVLFWLSHLLCFVGSLTEDLFSCRNLSDAHYQYLKPPGESVTLACPKNCSSGETRWYHSYVKKTATAAAGGGLDLLAWSGSSHEAAVGETPSQGSVGYFCCACEEEEDPARDGCCWGVGYQPVVNMTITASQGWTHEDETIAVPGARLSLSCKARGYPNISISISPPPSGANNSLSVAHQCREIVRSWYSTVVVCNWTTDTQQTGRFTCNGTIWLDSADNKIVPYLETTSQQLSICNVPSLVRLYQASSLEGPQLDLKCEIDCCRVSTCSVSWYFEGEEIDTRDSRFRISTEDEGLVHVLSVANPGVRDLGRYFCVLRSPLRDAPDKETVTITYPGGAAPTPMRLPPGPDKDGTSTTVNTSLVAGFMWVTISGAVIAAIAFALIVHRTRQPAVVEQGAKEYGDEVRLVRSSEPDDDVERDSIRHRVSEQTLPNDSDSSD